MERRIAVCISALLLIFFFSSEGKAASFQSRFSKKAQDSNLTNSSNKEVALQTEAEIPGQGSPTKPDIKVPKSKSPASKSPSKEAESSSPEGSSAPGAKEGKRTQENAPSDPPSLSPSFQLKQIAFETGPAQITIKIQATGGLNQLREEKLVNPGRLLLEIPNIANALNLNINALTDHLIVPRIRLAQHPDRLRVIVDTVLLNFPQHTLQKSDREIVIRLEKTPEMIAEAKSKADLFLAMQRNDREALLKMGSEDEGGILFAEEGRARVSSNGKEMASFGTTGQGGVKVEPGSGPANRIVFMLDDRKEYKIFIEDTQTPIHIRKIRPAYEVKGVQSRLNQLGYGTGLEDGSVGPQTREALKRFQQDRGLTVTGTPNKKTQRELRKEFGY